MDDDEFISILTDTNAGLSPPDGYGETIAHARALIAERDRLAGAKVDSRRAIAPAGPDEDAADRARRYIDYTRRATHVAIAEDELIVVVTMALLAVIDELHRGARDTAVLLREANDARDRLRGDLTETQWIRDAYEYATAVAEAERDALREAVDAERVEHAEVHGELIVRMRESRWREIEAERDRLREELAFVGFAVVPEGRTGLVEEHEIVPMAKAIVAERDRLRAAVVDWLEAVARAESPTVTQAALNHLGAMVGWQLDGGVVMGGEDKT